MADEFKALEQQQQAFLAQFEQQEAQTQHAIENTTKVMNQQIEVLHMHIKHVNDKIELIRKDIGLVRKEAADDKYITVNT